MQVYIVATKREIIIVIIRYYETERKVQSYYAFLTYANLRIFDSSSQKGKYDNY